MGDQNADTRLARRNMLKAYITFSTEKADEMAEKRFFEYVQDISDSQS